jgi:DNA-binding response OmpR family regulator
MAQTVRGSTARLLRQRKMGPMTALLVHTGGLRDLVCALQLGWANIEIVHASTPDETHRALATQRPDIIAIDTSDGSFELAREVRRRTSAVVVAVSSRYSESALISAVEAGCDDYMEASASAPTFVARVRAAVRRVNNSPSAPPADIAACGNLEVDPAGYEARVAGKLLRLTAKEFELLLYLAKRSGQVARHETLSKLIWGEDSDLYGPWLRKYVQHLRQKLAEVPQSDVSIVTVPRVGYKLVGQMNGPTEAADGAERASRPA